MRKIALILMIITMSLGLKASKPDLLVTQNGETLNVYNLDISLSGYIYYTLSDDANSPILKKSKDEILIIKKSDGTKIDPSKYSQTSVGNENVEDKKVVNPGQHDPVTHKVTNTFYSKKAEAQILTVEDGKGQVLYMRVLSGEEKTLSVTPHNGDGKGKYEGEIYIIPDFVEFENEIYSVISVDDYAFSWNDKNLKDIVFPSTLKSIGKSAFYNLLGLEKIILPESLEYIGEYAFCYAGLSAIFEQLYIPKGVKKIGENAFRFVGPNTSFKGFFQGNLTSIPDFITVGNCTSYGIDEEAIEAYEKRYLKNIK